jgi:hypothetical protein
LMFFQNWLGSGSTARKKSITGKKNHQHPRW